MGKDYEFVRLGMIEGVFPFATAFKKKASSSLKATFN